MRLALILSFLTFVVVIPARGAPDTDLKTSPIDTRPTSPNVELGASLYQTRKNVDHALSFSAGWMSGSLIDVNTAVDSGFLGITQTNYNRNFTAQEFGIELLINSQIGLHWGFKTLLALGQRWEPYYKWGVGGLYKSSEGAGSFINYERYQARAAFGFEDIMNWRRNFRSEAGLAYSRLGISYQITFSITFN